MHSTAISTEPLPPSGPSRTSCGALVGSMGFSTVLWQLGNKLDAALVVAEAERTARGIADPEKRALRFKNLEVFKSAIAEDPPLPLSVVPKPRLKPPPPVSGGLPPFPITVEGFRSSASAIASKAAESDQVFLTTLYALAGAQDRIGLAKQAATAVSARQRVLGVASLEHLLIQAGALDGAEEAARAIPGDGLDLTLAKAEALAAAGRAWAVSCNLDNSVRCFNDAVAVLTKVRAPALALGKVKVAAAIAGLEADSRLAGASAGTFDLAMAWALQVPFRTDKQTTFRPEYRDDAYRAVFLAAINEWRNS